MKKNIFRIGSLLAILGVPSITFAAGKTLRDIVLLVTDYLQIAIGLLISLAVVTFVWNVYVYFFTDKDKKEAGLYVLYSTVGFFVILSLWGLVALLTNTFKLENTPPAFPFGSSGSTGTSAKLPDASVQGSGR